MIDLSRVRNYYIACVAYKDDAKKLTGETIAYKALAQIGHIYKAEEVLKELHPKKARSVAKERFSLLWRLTLHGKRVGALDDCK